MRKSFLSALILTCLLTGCRQPPRAQVDDTPEITSVVADDGIRVEPGLTSKFKVTIARKNFTDPVRVELRDLPAGVSAKSVVIPAKETVGEFEIAAEPDVLPGTTTGTHALAKSGDALATSKPFSIRIAPPSITFTIEPPQLKLAPGQSKSVKVTLVRGREAYQGPIEIKLAELPRGVEWTPAGKDPKGSDTTVFQLKAADDVTGADVKAHIRAIGANETRGVALLPLHVLGPAFTLKVEPLRVKSAFGKTAKITISAMRKDYQGPIAIKLDNMPTGVKVKPITLPAKQSTAEVDLIIANDAASVDKSIQVSGTTNDLRQAKSSFDLRIEGRPFTLLIKPLRFEVVQGSSTRVKVTAARASDYTGPIALELRNLPKGIKASSFGVAPREKTAEIEIIADDTAALGDFSTVQLLGSATIGGEKRDIKNDKVILRVLPIFSLSVQPARIDVVEGQKATVKVSADRRTYNGTISVELRNLPKGVSAAKAMIPRDKTFIDIELSADPGTGGAKALPHALGTTISSKQVASAGFNVNVVGKLFDLQVDKVVKVTFGSSAMLRVAVKRLDYQGPIELDLKNLPTNVKAAKVLIPAGQNDADIELVASSDAKEAKADAQVIATAVTAGRRQREADPTSVQVIPGLFDLKIDPVVVKLHHGGTAKVKVTAQRKGHDGPIALELRNLPMHMKADKVTLAKGETVAEIEVKADASVSDGAKVDVYARGLPMGVNKTIESTRFTVAVVSIGQPPGVELKVPANIQITQGGTVKVKVVAARKGYAGPLTVDLRNLPADVESSKATIPAGGKEAEITLTARPKAEPSVRTDVCAVGLATASDNCPYASPQMTVRVMRK